MSSKIFIIHLIGAAASSSDARRQKENLFELSSLIDACLISVIVCFLAGVEVTGPLISASLQCDSLFVVV